MITIKVEGRVLQAQRLYLSRLYRRVAQRLGLPRPAPCAAWTGPVGDALDAALLARLPGYRFPRPLSELVGYCWLNRATADEGFDHMLKLYGAEPVRAGNPRG